MSLTGEYRSKDNDFCSVTFRVLASTSYSNFCKILHEIKVGTNLVLSSYLRYLFVWPWALYTSQKSSLKHSVFCGI